MGLCVSTAFCGPRAQDRHVRKRIRPECLGVFENRIARTRVVVTRSWSPRQPPLNIQVQDSPKSGHPSDDFYQVSYTGTSTNHGTSESHDSQESGRGTSESQDSQESHSNFVSSTDSESLDSAEYNIIYDGLNMRATNRYQIGLTNLKAMIHHGADPNTLITHGDRSCLMFAVMANDFSFAKELVDQGVEINQSNSSGESALSLAIDMERRDIAHYLRSKGAVLQKNIRN